LTCTAVVPVAGTPFLPATGSFTECPAARVTFRMRAG
jgi:hypothetical protein